MGDVKEGRSKEEEFSHLLLKLVQYLSKRIEEMGQKNNNGSKGKGVQGDFQVGERSDTLQHQVAPHITMPRVPYTPARSTIPTFMVSGIGGQHALEKAHYGEYFIEYQSYGPEFGSAITFKDFCQLKTSNKPKGQSGGGYMQNNDFQCIVGVDILGCWGSIGCAVAPKICGGTRVHEISKTQKAI